MIAVAACSGGGSSSSGGGGNFDGGFTGVEPCSAGIDAGTGICQLSLPLQGGISGTFGSHGCGDEGGTTLDWQTGSLNGSVNTSIQITFPMAIPVDQTGTFSTTIQVQQSSSDGSFVTWKTPTGGCSTTIDGSICSPTSVFTNRRVLSGHGSCSQPAAPQMGNGDAPVQIGNFEFVGFFNP
jgi:hypothetical protein